MILVKKSDHKSRGLRLAGASQLTRESFIFRKIQKKSQRNGAKLMETIGFITIVNQKLSNNWDSSDNTQFDQIVFQRDPIELY